MKRIIIMTMTLLFVLVVFQANIRAQHGYRIEKRISFRGKTSATAKGIIPNILEGHEYIFTVRKGQTLTADLSSVRRDISFSIVSPSGEYLSEETELRQFNTILPEGGDYHIIINTSEKGAVRYTLTLTVE